MVSYLKSKRDWAVLCLTFQGLVAIAAIAITVTQLDYSYYGAAADIYDENAWAKKSCTLSLPTTSVADWLCGYLYATSVIGIVLLFIIILPVIAVCCGKQSRIWYRGGFYKIAQAFLLFVGFVFWLVLAIYVTKYGIEANTYPYMKQDAWRLTVVILSWLGTAFYLTALALRLLDEGGSITRAEMDFIASGEKVVEIKNRGYYVDDQGDVRGWGSAKLPPNVLHKKVLRTYERKYQVDGYYPDTKDPRDRIFIPWHPKWYGSWLTLPRMVDLSLRMPEVLDQGQMGTCVVNSMALAYRYTVSKSGGKDFKPSRLFLFFNTKYHIMNEYPDGKGGSITRAACQALRKYGCCSEQTYPYNPDFVSYEPPQYAYDEAKQHKVSYYVVPPTKYDIYSALAQGHPIMTSISFIDAEYQALDDDHIFPYLRYPDEADMYTLEHFRSDENLVGHHAICLVGYDKQTDIVKFQNSYGKTWGDNGCMYAPVDYLLNPTLAKDFWIFRKAK